MSLLAAAGIDLGRGPTAQGDVAGSTLNWQLVRRVLGFTRPYAFKRNIVFALTLLRAMQKPALAWSIAAVINGPISGGDWSGTMVGAGFFLTLAIITEVTFHFRQRYALELGEAVVHDLRQAVFSHVQAMPIAYFHRTTLGSLLGRVITDIEAVRRGVQNVFFFSLLLCGQMIGSALLMLWYNPLLFSLLLAIGPVVWAINRYFHPRLSAASRAVAESQSRLTGTLAETIKGVRVIQTCTRQDFNDGRFNERLKEHADNHVRLGSASALYTPLLDLNSQIFTASLLLVGGWGLLHARAGVEVGSLIAFLFLPNLFFQSLQHLAQLYTQAIVAMAGAERVFGLLDERPEWEEQSEVRVLPDPRGKGLGGRPEVAGWRVEFDGVSFGYESERPVLHDISLTALPGQTVALVGPTGSGKSTIVSLLTKLYPVEQGRIRIDGYDLRSLSGSSLRAQTGVVTQQNFLFTGSVLDNIRFGRPSASEEDVRAAASALDCLDLLERLPQGLRTEVGERGSGVSLGQRQLICFVRAFLADPRLLVLDEATSAVDTVTESRLQQSLHRLLVGRTSFVVAHRLSTVRHADQILVLANGRIAERGTHEDLLRGGGPYARLYAQFSRPAAA